MAAPPLAYRGFVKPPIAKSARVPVPAVQNFRRRLPWQAAAHFAVQFCRNIWDGLRRFIGQVVSVLETVRRARNVVGYVISFTLLAIFVYRRCDDARKINSLVGDISIDLRPADIVSKGDIAMVHKKDPSHAIILIMMR